MGKVNTYLAEYGSIIPWAASSTVLVGLGVFSPLPVLLTGLVSAAVFVGTRLMLHQTTGLLELPDDLVQAIANGEEVTVVIKQLSTQIKKPGLREKLDSITSTAEKIFENLRRKPSDARVIREFLDSYLGTTRSILEKYVELTKQNVQDQEVAEILKKVEDSIEQIDSLFKKQQVKLLRDGAIDLDVQLEVLKTRMKME